MTRNNYIYIIDKLLRLYLFPLILISNKNKSRKFLYNNLIKRKYKRELKLKIVNPKEKIKLSHKIKGLKFISIKNIVFNYKTN
ncbi:hypothetical protein EV215_1359 [Hypnocyclicus thermotrophus]|uniref:Uncharacterized protein n=1 Tax=Hypnocyclicus thermotrophus TaxID=1627895 RepID=A0AA46DYN6_9FUSO|nr:hypothetical protein [Hypnocyclicus thermotrophus]TDT69817.1 hypothetical protein EV215_1359 [Hypnocyclicus thermotrophus]